MGILIRNTETGEEVTLDIGVAEEIAAEMKESVINTAAIATLGKFTFPKDVVDFAVATLVGQVAFLSIIKPEVSKDFEAISATMLAETGTTFLKPGEVQAPVQKPSQPQEPKPTPPLAVSLDGETVSAEEFLRMWDPPKERLN